MATVEMNEKKLGLRCGKLEMKNKEYEERFNLMSKNFADEKLIAAERELKKDAQIEGCNAHIENVSKRITKIVGKVEESVVD